MTPKHSPSPSSQLILSLPAIHRSHRTSADYLTGPCASGSPSVEAPAATDISGISRGNGFGNGDGRTIYKQPTAARLPAPWKRRACVTAGFCFSLTRKAKDWSKQSGAQLKSPTQELSTAPSGPLNSSTATSGPLYSSVLVLSSREPTSRTSQTQQRSSEVDLSA